ncbi:MAG: hypothetical protein WBG08_14455 [Litorimonas sp.]
MVEGFDWQPILIAVIAVMSLINGLSVLQNFRSDRADVRAAPVYDDDWMYWTELVVPNSTETIRRYVVIGHIARTNLGRRPTSIADTELKIRLRNRKTAPSPLYDIPPPELEISSVGDRQLPVMRPGPDPFDFRPMLHPGQSDAGIHCFLFGMYGSEVWAPQVDNGVLEGTLCMESGFGNTFKSTLKFRHVEFDALQRLFPSLESFMLNHLEGEA